MFTRSIAIIYKHHFFDPLVRAPNQIDVNERQENRIQLRKTQSIYPTKLHLLSENYWPLLHLVVSLQTGVPSG